MLAIADDASVGPLQDIDLPALRLRADFWEAVYDRLPEPGGATNSLPIATVPPGLLRQHSQEQRLVSAGLQRQLASGKAGWRTGEASVR